MLSNDISASIFDAGCHFRAAIFSTHARREIFIKFVGLDVSGIIEGYCDFRVPYDIYGNVLKKPPKLPFVKELRNSTWSLRDQFIPQVGVCASWHWNVRHQRVWDGSNVFDEWTRAWHRPNECHTITAPCHHHLCHFNF